jgi:transcriptional regulator with XRE-family HTH domain
MPRKPEPSPPDLRKLLGERVREMRHRLGVSQEELADRALLDRTYVSSLERGHRNVALENLCRLAAALQVDAGELIAGFPSPGPKRPITTKRSYVQSRKGSPRSSD